MAGMVEQAGAAKKPPQETAAAEQPAAGVKPTPEEAEAKERATLAAMDVLYDEKTKPGIHKMLQAGAADPALALAQAATTVVTGVDEQSGGQMPEVVILPVASEVLSDLIDIAQGNGYFEVSEEVKTAAFQQMMMLVGQQYDVDPQEIQALIDEMGPDQVAQIVQQQGGQMA